MEAIEGLPLSEAHISERLLEAEAAAKFGIVFDDNWYSIPVETREYMIASTVARQLLDSLSSVETNRAWKR